LVRQLKRVPWVKCLSVSPPKKSFANCALHTRPVSLAWAGRASWH